MQNCQKYKCFSTLENIISAIFQYVRILRTFVQDRHTDKKSAQAKTTMEIFTNFSGYRLIKKNPHSYNNNT